MVTDSLTIQRYLDDVIHGDEVFILLERKKIGGRYQYNYYTKGEPRLLLMSLAEIVEGQAQSMGLSFENAMDVMKNMHSIDTTMIESKKRKCIEKRFQKCIETGE